MKQRFSVLAFCLLTSTMVSAYWEDGIEIPEGKCVDSRGCGGSSSGGSSSSSNPWTAARERGARYRAMDAGYARYKQADDNATAAWERASTPDDWREVLRLLHITLGLTNEPGVKTEQAAAQAREDIAGAEGNLARAEQRVVESANQTKDQEALNIWNKGKAAYENGDLASGVSLFRQAIAHYPSGFSQENLKWVETQEVYKNAMDAFDRGDFHEALRLFRHQQSMVDEPNVRHNIKAAELQIDIKAGEAKEAKINQLGLARVEAFASKDLDGALRSARQQQALQDDDFIRGWIADLEADIADRDNPVDLAVVDARNVPSGLSKPVENAIAGAYANSPPGVIERVRKGFQAVASNDWRVANAWFEDAYKRDDGNFNLQRLIMATIGRPTAEVKAELKHSFATLSAAAGTMNTEEIMEQLMTIMEAGLNK